MNLRTCAVTLLVAGVALPAAGQRFPALGGLDLRGSAVENAADPSRPTAGAALDLDLGSFVAPMFRPFVGGTYFTAAAPAGTGDGELEVMGGRAGLRMDVLGNAAIAPYVYGAVTGLQVEATLDDEDAGELLSGFNTGATAGGGIVYSMGPSRRVGITAEGSYTWINNLNHWSAGVGLRFRPFGRGTYGRPAPPPARVVVNPATPTVQVVQASNPAVRSDSLSLEIEALRAEVARLAEAREAGGRGSDDADARVAEAAAQATRAAATAADAEAEARRLAAALTAAEARADSLARLSDASRTRAADAEARTGQALLELSRIASGTTTYRETERGIVITLGEGLFATGRTELSQTARAEVARVGYVVGHFRDRVIRVEGHTDAAGAEAANQALSERRAASVRAALIAEGVAPERVIAVGYGESRPAASNETAPGRSQNRRVEVLITDERP